MKLATYFRKREDDVKFFKGNLNDLAVDLLFEGCWQRAGNKSFANRISDLRLFIKDGRAYRIENIHDTALVEKIVEARKRYVKSDYPKFDMVCITTLFTFYWKETVATIENAKKFLSDSGKMFVGGIASTILRSEFAKATGIEPYINRHGGALLDKPGQIDTDSTDIIDELPLDYSLLDETNYKYPVSDSYFGYATRGCVNHCEFCAVPHLEPIFCGFKSIKRQIEQSSFRFGERKNLLLLDNNVLASNKFNAIIDEIKELGFSKGELYHVPNAYEIAIKNIKDNYNTRTYIKKIISFYDKVAELLSDEE